MNRFKQKLNNDRGASLIIAMVFMLICLFVGGSVLVAATMNTKRIEHEDENQIFLDRRSSASLIADDLRTDDIPSATYVKPLTLTIYKIAEQRASVNLTPNQKPPTDAMNVPATYSYKIEISGGMDPYSGFKRILFESAIRNYQHVRDTAGHPENPDGPIELSVINGDNSVATSTPAFWIEPLDPNNPEAKISEYLQITPSWTDKLGNAVNIDSYNAHFICKKADLSEGAYDFIVDFKQQDPAAQTDFSMLEVKAYASVDNDREAVVTDEIIDITVDKNGKKTGTRVRRETKVTTITWSSARVEKGDGV